MASTPVRAIVRPPAATFEHCIRPEGSVDPIDRALARRQHDAYAAVLAGQGIDVIRVDADDRYPDCCFVEDPVVIVGGTAVVCAMAALSRRGEGDALERVLAPSHRVHRMEPPAAMDGGDVIHVGRRLFVGLSGRTNAAGVEALRAVAAREGVEVMPVAVTGVLHLKSACTAIDDETVLIDTRHADRSAFAGLRLVEVDADESYAANALALGSAVVVSAGFPHTRDRVAAAVAGAGVRVVELGMSEFRKAGGSLTCLSILLDAI